MANRVKLTCLSSSTDKVSRNFNLRSDKDSWEGLMFFGPSVGKSFSFFRDDEEYMHTSMITEVHYLDNNMVSFHTLNSVYTLEIGPHQEPL